MQKQEPNTDITQSCEPHFQNDINININGILMIFYNDIIILYRTTDLVQYRLYVRY